MSLSSEDFIDYKIDKARQTLDEVPILMENQFWNTAVNRLYYACFYAVGALLFREGIEVSSHAGMRQKFGQHFIKNGIIDKDLGKHFTHLYEKRQQGDYDDFIVFEELETIEMYNKSREFVDCISVLLSKK